jgi:hypothetical protein
MQEKMVEVKIAEKQDESEKENPKKLSGYEFKVVPDSPGLFSGYRDPKMGQALF